MAARHAVLKPLISAARFILLFACATLFAPKLQAQTATLEAAAPRVTHVATVAPDVLGVTIEEGRVEYARQVPYVPQPGDAVIEPKGHEPPWVRRDGKIIGSLVGPNRAILYNFDRLVGEKLDAARLDQKANYTVTSPDDERFQAGVAPVVEGRKSKPFDMAETAGWQFSFPLRHVVYLRLPQPLREGARYTLLFNGLNLPAVVYAHLPSATRSEAVHVSHIGFRPDDPVKIAFLSLWKGSGGAHAYAPGTPFRVLNDRTGQAVHTGQIALSKAAGDKTEDAYNRNYNGTHVYEMEFAALQTPGRYRVLVEGVGCSYPFEIGPDVWRDAFRTSVKGLYTQRSGIPIGPPHSPFRRPRPFHPADGTKVFHSRTPLMDSGNGLNARGTDKGNFANLVGGKTDEIVPHAWGGYFDAGDWDRRVQHLEATNLLLELLEMYPALERENLNIPESKDDLPDLANEALWNLDFYKRMQTTAGGVRGGIESAEHPLRGEASWQESLAVMAYAPDVWSSYLYVASAVRAARWLENRKPQMARDYLQSALLAMNWAEAELPGLDHPRLPHQVSDARNFAAAELYRHTGEAKWHDLFLQTTVFRDPGAVLTIWEKHEQRDAAWTYINTQRPDVNQEVQRNARAALLREAEVAVEGTTKTGFRWTKQDRYHPVAWGRLGPPQTMSLSRAHWLTREPRYLRAMLLGAQQGAGANPPNVSYTTGVGHDFPRHPLIVDARVTNQSAPPGVTIFGPHDTDRISDHYMVKMFAPVTHPAPAQWPTLEAYFDVYLFPAVSEFVVGTIAQNAYAWGHLAARPD